MPVFGGGTQYAQPSDLVNLGMLGAAFASVAPTTQNAALLAASGLADASLQSRYILPLKQWGQDLVRAVCIVAAYDLMTSRGYSTQSPDDHIRQRYLDALAWFKSVGSGDDTPSYVIDSSVNQTGAVVAATTSDDSVVTTTEGGLQLTTTNVRGWTRRGGNTSDCGDWGNGAGSL
jgi:phage gp36-like protein